MLRYHALFLDQQRHPDADWPFSAAETCAFRVPVFHPVRGAHDIFAIADHMPLLTTLKVLRRTDSAVMQLADTQSSLHRGASANRTRTDAQSRAHKNFLCGYVRSQHEGTAARRGAIRTSGNI